MGAVRKCKAENEIAEMERRNHKTNEYTLDERGNAK
jgi:hypothetical protein